MEVNIFSLIAYANFLTSLGFCVAASNEAGLSDLIRRDSIVFLHDRLWPTRDRNLIK